MWARVSCLWKVTNNASYEACCRHRAGMRGESTEELCCTPELTLHLVQPWLQTGGVVWGDLYSALAQTAEAMMRQRMRLTAAVKNATEEFSMQFIASQELPARRDNLSVIYVDEEIRKFSIEIVSIETELRHFVSNCCTANQNATVCEER